VRALAGLVLAGIALSASSAAAAPDPALDVIAFFTGRTHADNIIKIAFHSPHELIVDSIGGHNREGQFVLIDTIQEEGKPVRKRTWVMRPAGANRYTGTLSDAVGPVDVTVAGDSATIRYTMREGHMKIEQQLKLRPDGSLSNRAAARKLGIKFATVEGTIRRVE
jgi:hypothetical protein